MDVETTTFMSVETIDVWKSPFISQRTDSREAQNQETSHSISLHLTSGDRSEIHEDIHWQEKTQVSHRSHIAVEMPQPSNHHNLNLEFDRWSSIFIKTSPISRECRGAGLGGLFLGRLVGNAESTHVDRLKGKAPLVPKFGSYCDIVDKLSSAATAI